MSVNNLSPINQKIVQDSIKAKETAAQNTPTMPKTINKKKLAVSIAAGIGISALVIGGILYNKKINSKAVKQLAEHIDFSEAQTLEDAIKFGVENLGIKKYKGFKEADLGVVNWINEGLVNINNLSKGKAVMPQKIIYKFLNRHSSNTAGGIMNAEGTLSISKNYIEAIKDGIKNMPMRFYSLRINLRNLFLK